MDDVLDIPFSPFANGLSIGSLRFRLWFRTAFILKPVARPCQTISPAAAQPVGRCRYNNSSQTRRGLATSRKEPAMFRFDPQKCLAEMRKAEKDDLLDRVT